MPQLEKSLEWLELQIRVRLAEEGVPPGLDAVAIGIDAKGPAAHCAFFFS